MGAAILDLGVAVWAIAPSRSGGSPAYKGILIGGIVLLSLSAAGFGMLVLF